MRLNFYLSALCKCYYVFLKKSHSMLSVSANTARKPKTYHIPICTTLQGAQ